MPCQDNQRKTQVQIGPVWEQNLVKPCQVDQLLLGNLASLQVSAFRYSESRRCLNLSIACLWMSHPSWYSYQMLTIVSNHCSDSSCLASSIDITHHRVVGESRIKINPILNSWSSWSTLSSSFSPKSASTESRIFIIRSKSRLLRTTSPATKTKPMTSGPLISS